MKSLFKHTRFLTRGLLTLAIAFGLFALPQVPGAKAVDTISSAVYIDANDDGTVDNIKLTFDTNMTACAYEAGDWTVNNAGSINVAITGINAGDPESTGEGDCNNSDAVVYLSVTADANETGGTTDPIISYTNQGNLNDLQDSGNITDKSNQTISDGASPIPFAAVTQDLDANGKVDHLQVQFTENIDDSAINNYNATTDYAPTSLAIANVSNEMVDAGEDCTGDTGEDDAFLCLVFDEDGNACTAGDQTGCDTGAVDQDLTWTGASVTIQDATTNAAPNLISGGLTEADGAAPIIVSRTTKDANSVTGVQTGEDGTLNGVFATFTENMDASTASSTDFIITTSADAALTESYADILDDTTLFFQVSDAPTDDTAELLKLRITGADGGIQDANGVSFTNEGSFTSATDGAAPFLLSATYSEVTPTFNGKLDRVTLLFSETTTITMAGADWDFIDDGSMQFNGDFDNAECTGSGVSATIVCTDAGTGTFDADQNETGGPGEPVWEYTNNSNNISDGTNNTPTFSKTLVDGAIPRIISRTYTDDSNDGSVDRLVVGFSEPVDYNGNDITQFAVTANDLTGFTNPTSVSGTGTDTLTFTTDATSNLTGVSGGTEPTLQYTQTGTSANRVNDASAANNELATEGSAANITDAAGPIITDIQIEDDAGSNGLIDKLVITWSEFVDTDDSSAPVLADFETLVLPDGQAVTGATITDPAGASNTVTLTSVTGQATANTAVGSTAISGDLSQEWVDDNSVAAHSSGASGNETITDAAAPISTTYRYLDNIVDGAVDRLEITFSENIATNTATIADFAYVANDLTGSAITSGSYNAETGTNVVTINLGANGPTNTTSHSTAPTIAYTDDASRAIADAASNQVATFGAQNLADGAAPYLNTATYSDSDANGTIDRVTLAWSENTTFTMAGADWDFSTAGDMTMAGDFLGGDCSGSGTATITCTDANNSDVTADANETGKQTTGGAEPVWAYTNNSNNISDGTNNTAAFSKTLADGASPLVLSSTINYASGAMTMTFSEVIDASATDLTKVHVNDVSTVDAPIANLTGATVTDTDATTINVTLTAAQIATAGASNDLRDTAGVSGGDGGANLLDLDAVAIQDVSGNSNAQDDGNTITESSTASPTNPDIDLTNTTTGKVTSFDVSFTNINPIPADGKIQIVFPVEFNIVGADTLTATSLTNIDGTLTASVTGTTMTLTRGGGATIVATGQAISFTIAGGINGAAGNTGTFTLRTQDSSDNTLDEDTAVPGVSILAEATTTTTTTTSSGGGGGGGGGGGIASGGVSVSPTSNTVTSLQSSTVNKTATNNKSYSRPMKFTTSLIRNDAEIGKKMVNLTSVDGTITLKPNKKSTVSVKFPEATMLEANAEWDGKIDPPILRTRSKVSKLGGTITGSSRKLHRANVLEVVEVGSRKATLNFSKKVEVEVPIENADGKKVAIYSSPDAKEWTLLGEGIVEDGKVKFKTDHFSFFAIEDLDPEVIVEDEELRGAAPSIQRLVNFGDIGNHWAEGYIKSIAEKGIVSGKTTSRFAPNDNVSRAEALKIALNAFGYVIPEQVDSKPYADVSVDAWYAPYAQVAKENGLVQAGRFFNPNEAITRAETLKILIEAANFEDVFEVYQSNYLSKEGWWYVAFKDVLIGEWYSRYVAYAYVNNVVAGYEDGSFRPLQQITRAEVAKMVTKLMNL